MTGVLVPVFGLALLDSLNPSAVAITLYLLLSGGSFVSRVLSYAAGIFSANFVLGSALMLGLGSVRGLFDGPVAYGAQAVVGAALLGYAILAPGQPKKEKKERRPRSLGPGAVFLLGMTITVVEFSTALPYLGAVAILTNAGLSAAQWLPVLAAYNLVFVAPPLLLLGAYRAFGAPASGVRAVGGEAAKRRTRDAALDPRHRRLPAPGGRPALLRVLRDRLDPGRALETWAGRDRRPGLATRHRPSRARAPHDGGPSSSLVGPERCGIRAVRKRRRIIYNLIRPRRRVSEKRLRAWRTILSTRALR